MLIIINLFILGTLCFFNSNINHPIIPEETYNNQPNDDSGQLKISKKTVSFYNSSRIESQVTVPTQRSVS